MTNIQNNANIIGVKELRLNLEKYIVEISAGKSFTVVRRSKPVFKVSPVDEEQNWETVADFTKIKKGGVSAKELLKALEHV